jgi:hypothetical protein
MPLHPPLHTVVQAPQFSGSRLVLTHAPLQSVRPGRHTQLPCWQTRSLRQTVPQPPQLASSVWLLTHRPPQQVSPAGQAAPQPPQLAVLVWVSTHWPPPDEVGQQDWRSGQTVAQAPQLLRSWLTSTHCPRQLLKPGWQRPDGGEVGGLPGLSVGGLAWVDPDPFP